MVGGAALALTAGPIGVAAGVFVPGPAEADGLFRAAAIALVAPALLEEFVFRGALVPDLEEAKRARWAIVGSTAAFVAWHVFEGLVTLPQARELFLRPSFLAIAGLLGLVCAVLRRRSGTIWTAVALHWGAVVAWKAWLGGPRLF